MSAPNDTAAIERASRVRLMIFDVDGVLTDGSLHFGPEGEVSKTFNVLCLLYTSPSPRDKRQSRMPSSA